MHPKKPIKRHESLQPLSHEHHDALLLCWKIRTGLKNKTDVSRIKEYTNSFFQNILKPHFKIEENHLFPIVDYKNELIQRALADHRRLTIIFESVDNIRENLELIEKELESHVRFEERLLFNLIQAKATKEQLEIIKTEVGDKAPEEIWKDQFWENK